MANIKYVHVRIDEARYLADLNGIKIDLESTISLCNALRQYYESKKYTPDIVDAFTTAILIRYSRPFMDGVRERIYIDKIKGLSREDIEEHEKYRAYRSLHIAHSINQYENNTVIAYYNDEKVMDEGIRSIEVIQDRVIGLSSSELINIEKLSRKILIYVRDKIVSEKARILGIVQKLSIEQVLKQGTKVPPVPKVDKRRK